MRVPDVFSAYRPVLTSAFVRVLALTLALPAYSLISAGGAPVHAGQEAGSQKDGDTQDASGTQDTVDAQGTDSKQDAQSKAEASTATPGGQKQQARRVRRPYLGARPDIEPGGEAGSEAVGKAQLRQPNAKSILPAPYVAPGSLTFDVPVPPAGGAATASTPSVQPDPNAQAVEATQTTQATQAPSGAQAPSGLENGINASQPQPVAGSTSLSLDGVRANEGEGTPSSDPFAGLFGGQIVAGNLKDLDASVQAIAPLPVQEGAGDFGYAGATSFFSGFWRGYTHQGAVEALAGLTRADLQPALRRLAARAAASQFDLKVAGTEAEQIALIKARLRVFETLGDIRAYAALLDTLPPNFGVGASTPAEGLDLERINAALLSGDLAGACALSEGVREAQASAYGLRIAVVCAAVRGNRQAADFSLRVLEELETVAPDFYELTDILLIEAEQASRGSVQMRAPLRLTPLSVATAQVGGAEVTALDFSGATPLGIKAALSLPKMSISARASLLRTALQSQIVAPQSLLETMAAGRNALSAASVGANAEAPAGYAQLLASSDAPITDFMFDMQLMAALSNAQVPPYARTALLQQLVKRAAADNRLAGMADALLSMSADIASNGPEYAGTLQALRLRLALLAGRADTARESVLALRSTGTDDNPQSAAALIASLPLMQMATNLDTAEAAASFSPPLTPARFGIWWQALSAGRIHLASLAPAALEAAGIVTEGTAPTSSDETKGADAANASPQGEAASPLSPLAQASLFLSASEGLGMPYVNADGNALWQQLDSPDTPQTLVGVAAASPVLWRSYMQARLSGDRPAMLVAVSRLMAGQSAHTAEPAMVGSVVEGLCAAGFCADAQALSLGLLVDAGL